MKNILSKIICFFFCLCLGNTGLMAAHIVKEEFIFTKAPFASCHSSSIVEVKPGVFLSVWFGGTVQGHNDVAIWSSRWENDTWTPPVKIAEADHTPCWDPVLFKAPSGDILLFYKAGPSPIQWTGFIKRSHDNGILWSEAEKLPAGVLGPTKGKPLLLNDGTLLCGSSRQSWHADASWIDVTRDEGKTWEKWGPIVTEDPRYGVIQPVFFGHTADKLGILCRPRGGLNNICMATSLDQGKTWSLAKPIAIPNPDSAIDTLDLKNGVSLLACNPISKDRTKLALFESHNDGESWNEVLVLENANSSEFSFPFIIQSADGLIHITYTWKRQVIKHVVIGGYQ